MNTVDIYSNENQTNLNNNLELLLETQSVETIKFAKQIVKTLRKQVQYFKKDDLLELIEINNVSPENACFALLSVYKATGLPEPLLPSDFSKPCETPSDFLLKYLKTLDSYLVERLVYFIFPLDKAKDIWERRLPLIERL